MKSSVVGSPSRAALLLAAALLAAVILEPRIARAGLLGDEVTATLTDLDTDTEIFTGSETVVDPGIEFSFLYAFRGSLWELDLNDLGFTLTGTCVDDSISCDYSSGLQLSISDLDFFPPGDLVGLLGASGDFGGTPSVTASSVTIIFAPFELSTEGPQSYSARFDVDQAPSTVPVPATLLLLLLAGGLALSFLPRRRGRS